MVMEKLNSDRVNYLVWRYLQESNYADTALSLAKSWNQEDPDAVFNPNGYIKHHTLINILQKGLFYDDLERSVSRERNGTQGFFAPVTAPPTPPVQEEQEAIIDSRKRSVEEVEPELQSSSPFSKRPKVADNNAGTTSPLPMDVDDHEESNGQVYPSPKEADRSETPTLMTNGPETAMQLDQPTDLMPNTTFLSISDEVAASTTQLYHCKWNPRTASILAVAGGDALVRFWNLPNAVSADHSSDVHLTNGDLNGHNRDEVRYWHVGDETAPPNTSVSAFCWEPQGRLLAMATDAEDQDYATILIHNVERELIRKYNTPGTPILSLMFNTPGDFVLGIGISKDTELSLTMMSVNMHKTVVRNIVVSSRSLTTNYPKTIWTDDYEFLLCTVDALQLFSFNRLSYKIEPLYKFELGNEQEKRITNVAYDTNSKLIATSTENGDIDVWNKLGEKVHNCNAHRERITSLAWQPVQNNLGKSDQGCLLASASEDGSIAIWDIEAGMQVKCSMMMDTAIQAVAFSPIGTHIAASTVKDTMIWNVNDASHPVAHWPRPSDAGFESPKSTASQAEDQVLCWDANGQTLACLVNNQIAITTFQEG